MISSTSLNFPSASGIEFYQNKLYVFGDDASYLLILSPSYQVIDTIHYLPKTDGRISKETKPDIESAMLVRKNGKTVLAGVGSMSAQNRHNIFYFSFDSSSFQMQSFHPNSIFSSVSEVNIEGSCTVDNIVVYSNRANLKNRLNHLLVWNGNDSLTVKEIILPTRETMPGISGLFYCKEKDLLLFTASEEATTNAIQDGTIGESYLGWINRFSTKLNAPGFSPDGWLRLSDFHASFQKQKIESVCVESSRENNLLLHLAADNDDGKSNIYKVELSLK